MATSKTQTISLRLDQKTKFILDFMARVRGQNITTIIERAIKEAADRTGVGERDQKDWKNYWHPDEGVRTLKVICDSDIYTSFSEDEILEFTKVHWKFFYGDDMRSSIRDAYVQVLWPRIEEYVDIWNSTRSQDYWAAGKEMAKDLLSAKVQPPDWPPQAPAKSGGPPRKSGLDDDIPF